MDAESPVVHVELVFSGITLISQTNGLRFISINFKCMPPVILIVAKNSLSIISKGQYYCLIVTLAKTHTLLCP